jgi:hypothetical protein
VLRVNRAWSLRSRARKLLRSALELLELLELLRLILILLLLAKTS